MYLFIHHEFLLFKNQKQRAEVRGDKVKKINMWTSINSFQATTRKGTLKRKKSKYTVFSRAILVFFNRKEIDKFTTTEYKQTERKGYKTRKKAEYMSRRAEM